MCNPKIIHQALSTYPLGRLELASISQIHI